MLSTKNQPSNNFKKFSPVNLPRLDKSPVKAYGIQENISIQNGVQSLGDNAQRPQGGRLSKQTNELALKGLLKQRNLFPMEPNFIPIPEQKRINNSYHVASKDPTKNDSRANSRGRSVKRSSKENLSLVSKGTFEKKDKTNHLIKIYNPTNPVSASQPPPKKPMYRLRKKSKDEVLTKAEPRKTTTEEPDNNYFLTMSFGKEDFQKALGIDIKQLIGKGLNGMSLKEENEGPESRTEEKSDKPNPTNNRINKRKSIKAKPVPQTVVKSPYNEVEMSFDNLNLGYDKNAKKEENDSQNTLRDLKLEGYSKNSLNPMTENHNVLRDTPTFNLPLALYKERSECKEIRSPSGFLEGSGDKKEGRNQKVEAPSIFSNDFLLDDLMEDLKKNALIKPLNDPNKAGVMHSEFKEKDPVIQSKPREKSPKASSPKKSKRKSGVLEDPKDKRKDEKCLLIDFDDDSDSEEDDLVIARNNSPVEKGFKLIKHKNIEVFDLNDL